MEESLGKQAEIYDYRRVSFQVNWQIRLPLSARKILETAAYFARLEGNINHAKSIEARLDALVSDGAYYVGRLRNGCATAQIRP
jgi:hypothetical protein